MKKILEIFVRTNNRISREIIKLPSDTSFDFGEVFRYGEDTDDSIIRIWVRKETELDQQFENELNGKH